MKQGMVSFMHGVWLTQPVRRMDTVRRVERLMLTITGGTERLLGVDDGGTSAKDTAVLMRSSR